MWAVGRRAGAASQIRIFGVGLAVLGEVMVLVGDAACEAEPAEALVDTDHVGAEVLREGRGSRGFGGTRLVAFAEGVDFDLHAGLPGSHDVDLDVHVSEEDWDLLGEVQALAERLRTAGVLRIRFGLEQTERLNALYSPLSPEFSMPKRQKQTYPFSRKDWAIQAGPNKDMGGRRLSTVSLSAKV